jgi:D-glycero-D-manno-heptose 1,7-bisphosphate phosphatase
MKAVRLPQRGAFTFQLICGAEFSAIEISFLSVAQSKTSFTPMLSSDLLKHSFQKVRYVFLDRDGVINRKPLEGEYVDHWAKFELLPGAESSIAALNRSGRRVIVVTNQRGVALGLYTCAEVEALHSRLQQHLARHGARIDAFYYCPHDKNQCDCRKPKTGLFQQAFRDFPEAAPTNSLVIGDSISDIEAARNLGIPAIFICGDPTTQKPGAENAAAFADAISDSLAEAVDAYLS